MKKLGISYSLFLLPLFFWAQQPASVVPNFTFYRFTGQAFTNHQLNKQQPLFFCFFDVTCSHCQHAVAEIAEHYPAFKNKFIYLISMDNEAAVTTFLNTYSKALLGKANVTLLHDTNYEFINQFKPRKYPSLFLYSNRRVLIKYTDNDAEIAQFYQ